MSNKFTIRRKHKQLLALLAAAVILCASAFCFVRIHDNRQFQSLTEDIFCSELEGNTLNLHYTIAHPENYGLDDYQVVLPCYSAESRVAGQAELAAYLKRLSKLSPGRLSEENQYTYTLLNSYLTNTLRKSNFAYYDEPLAPSSGMQSELPILLAEYTFRSERDIQDYLALIDQADEYFDSLFQYETEKKQAGLLQADTSLAKVRKQCDTILSKEELAFGTHFLQTTFAERLIPLIESGVLSEAQAQSYLADNSRLLTTVMQPAYEKLSGDLAQLMGDGSVPTGLSTLPQGKEYFSLLVHTTTGSSLNMEQIKAMLYPQFEKEYKTLHTMLLSRDNIVDTLRTSLDGALFPYTSPEDMIADLQSRMSDSFPPFTSQEGTQYPGLTVKTVSDSLENYSAPAFYLTPPLDDTNSNVIYINRKSTPAGLELYTTLAHEGYPGHLYQSVYSQQQMQTQDSNPVRQILWYGGYLEGWALYVEFLSYDYASQLMKERGLDDAAYAYEIEKHSRNMQLCLYSILDIAIHYDGATYEQVHDVLASFGLSNPKATRAVYDYIAEAPANYLKYYLGYMEILRLQDNARTKWQDAYSDYRFHQFFLECGPSDFASLEAALKASSDRP